MRNLKNKKCVICGEEFEPYSGAQKVCGSKNCRIELYSRSFYKKKIYKFKPEFIKKNSNFDLNELEFTLDDIIKKQNPKQTVYGKRNNK
jgi:hypothetical protein